jgi:hypothetical protein
MNTSLRRPRPVAASLLTLSAAEQPTLKKPNSDEDHTLSRQTREVQQRFVLKIDGQGKRSFGDKEAALQAGREIKKTYPVVKAVVYDSQEGINEDCRCS